MPTPTPDPNSLAGSAPSLDLPASPAGDGFTTEAPDLAFGETPSASSELAAGTEPASRSDLDDIRSIESLLTRLQDHVVEAQTRVATAARQAKQADESAANAVSSLAEAASQERAATRLLEDAVRLHNEAEELRDSVSAEADKARERIGEASAQVTSQMEVSADDVKRRLSSASAEADSAVSRVGRATEAALLATDERLRAMATTAAQVQAQAEVTVDSVRRSEAVTERAARLAAELSTHEGKLYTGVREAQQVAKSVSADVGQFREVLAAEGRLVEGLKRQVEARSSEVVHLNTGMNRAVSVANGAAADVKGLHRQISSYTGAVVTYGERVASTTAVLGKATEARARDLVTMTIVLFLVALGICGYLFVAAGQAGADDAQDDARLEALTVRLQALEAVQP